MAIMNPVGGGPEPQVCSHAQTQVSQRRIESAFTLKQELKHEGHADITLFQSSQAFPRPAPLLLWSSLRRRLLKLYELPQRNNDNNNACNIIK